MDKICVFETIPISDDSTSNAVPGSEIADMAINPRAVVVIEGAGDFKVTTGEVYHSAIITVTSGKQHRVVGDVKTVVRCLNHGLNGFVDEPEDSANESTD